MNKVRKYQIFAAIVFGLFTLFPQFGLAQEKINVTVMSGYTDRTVWIRTLKEFWMPEVNKRLSAAGNYELNYLEAFGTVVQPRGEFDAIGNGTVSYTHLTLPTTPYV